MSNFSVLSSVKLFSCFACFAHAQIWLAQTVVAILDLLGVQFYIVCQNLDFLAALCVFVSFPDMASPDGSSNSRFVRCEVLCVAPRVRTPLAQTEAPIRCCIVDCLHVILFGGYVCFACAQTRRAQTEVSIFDLFGLWDFEMHS